MQLVTWVVCFEKQWVRHLTSQPKLLILEVNFLQLETYFFECEIFKSLLLKYNCSLWLSPTAKQDKYLMVGGERYGFTTDAMDSRRKKDDEY